MRFLLHLRSCAALLLLLYILIARGSHGQQQLSASFYASSCPNAVSTIANTFNELSKKDNVIAPSMLRLILHDCFVEGCDGSILLSSTGDNKAERDAPDNLNLPQNAFNAVIEGKKAVEAICPGVVSCADILALMSRDAVSFLGGPSWDVPLGRLDGRVSKASSVTGRLPGANFNVKQLSDNFAGVGLSLQDMVVLSGAHSIGFSHCDQFKNRLYSFNSSVKLDPSIDPAFAQQLQQKCPASGGDGNLQAFDSATPFGFDNSYFKALEEGKGVLFSDQVLFEDQSTKGLVEAMASSQEQFFESFKAAMVKMTAIAVKGKGNGEVRKECTVVNSGSFPSPSPVSSSSPPSPVPPSPSSPSTRSPSPPSPSPSSPSPPSPSSPSPPSPSSPSPSPPSPSSPSPSPPSSPSPLHSPPPSPVLLPPRPPALPPPSPPVVARPEPVLPPPSPRPQPPVGITIPGIPGFLPPIHLPFGPGFGGGGGSDPPPPSSSSTSSSSSSSSPATIPRKGF